MTWRLSPVLFMREGRELAETVEKRFQRMEKYLGGVGAGVGNVAVGIAGIWV